MAVEGEFPKVDGDVLFASEVNGFNDIDLETTNNLITITPTESSISYSDNPNIYDGDHNTFAEAEEAGGQGSTGHVLWDLGEVKSDLNLIYNIDISFNTNSSTSYFNQAYLEISEDNSSWESIEFQQSGQSASRQDYDWENIKTGYKFRYLRLRLLGATSGSAVYAANTLANIYQLKIVERI